MLNELNRGLGLNVDARRDWKILCRVFFLLIFLFLIIDIYFFNIRNSLNGDDMGFQAEVYSDLDRSKLNRVVSDWRAKELRFNEALKEKSALVDPSL